MAANFIFEGPDRLRVTSYSAVAHYDVGELNFYISTKFGQKLQVFMILKNESGLYEIVELTKAGASGQNILYKLPINQRLRVGNEKVQLSILVLNDDLYYISQPTNIQITTDNYVLARQVYIAQEVGSVVQDCYARTLALVEQLNEKKKGDN